jgi:tripartite motif-containing protein 71
VWLAVAGINRFAKFDTNGKLLYHWGVFGAEPGQGDNPHQFDVDNAGNLYVADANNNRIQKFVPKKNADKSHLIGQEVKLKK